MVVESGEVDSAVGKVVEAFDGLVCGVVDDGDVDVGVGGFGFGEGEGGILVVLRANYGI